MGDTLERIIQIASKRFGLDAQNLRPSDDFFEKLKIDSVAALALLSELEIAFDVEVPDYELQGLKTFEQLAAVIEKRRTSNA